MIQKRDGARNFFPLPNEIFNLGLSAGEIVVYAYLMFRENRKTYQCYPSYTHVTTDMQKKASGIVGDFLDEIM